MRTLRVTRADRTELDLSARQLTACRGGIRVRHATPTTGAAVPAGGLASQWEESLGHGTTPGAERAQADRDALDVCPERQNAWGGESAGCGPEAAVKRSSPKQEPNTPWPFAD